MSLWQQNGLISYWSLISFQSPGPCSVLWLGWALLPCSILHFWHLRLSVCQQFTGHKGQGLQGKAGRDPGLHDSNSSLWFSERFMSMPRTETYPSHFPLLSTWNPCLGAHCTTCVSPTLNNKSRVIRGCCLHCQNTPGGCFGALGTHCYDLANEEARASLKMYVHWVGMQILML